MSNGEIAALGYLGIEVSNIPGWISFARDVLGIEVSERADGTVDLRLDNYATRIRLHPGPGDDLAYAGWEVSDASALASLENRLLDAGIGVERLEPDMAADRRVAEAIRFTDPEGSVLEAFYGPLQRTNHPAVSPLGVKFKTGSQGLGHIVLSCADHAAMLGFYTNVLGFRISDHILTEIMPGRRLHLTFMRCNPRHHSLAIAAMPALKKIVHLMIEVLDLDDVGRAMHRCLKAGVHLSITLGRHSNDEMLSFYPMTPSGFDIEYGWGAIAVDDESWHVLTHDVISSWGHTFQRPPRVKPPADPTV